MRVAVIIPSLANEKTYPFLKLCVESLRATVDWDIIVVTNGTKTAQPHNLDIPGVTMRLHTSDQGQCNAVNIGAHAANPGVDYYFVINDDMYFAPNWNQNLRFDYPVFSPNLVEPTDNAGSAPPFLKFDGGLELGVFKRKKVDAFVKEQVNRVYDFGVDDVEDGFNLPFFIRKDVWQTIGGYDIAYDPYGSNSDTDLQTLIEIAGVMPKRLRDVLVYHFSNKSETFTPDKQAFWQHNWDYYTQKLGFNRDWHPECSTWYCKNMIDKENLKFHPAWEGKYEDTNDR